MAGENKLYVSGNVEGVAVESKTKEYAIKLLYIFIAVLIFAISIAALLIWDEKIDFNNGLVLILASISPFPGLFILLIILNFAANVDENSLIIKNKGE